MGFKIDKETSARLQATNSFPEAFELSDSILTSLLAFRMAMEAKGLTGPVEEWFLRAYHHGVKVIEEGKKKK